MIPQRKRPAFTIIELLVAIAVIAILAAFLYPVVMRAVERGREVQCSARLGAIGKGVMLYAQDHDMNLPGPLSSPAFGGWYCTPRQKDYTVGNLLSSFVAPYLDMELPPEKDGFQARFSENFVCPAWLDEVGDAASDRQHWLNTCYVVQKWIIVDGERVGYGKPWGTPVGNPTSWGGPTPMKLSNMDDPANYWMLTELDTAGNLGATASVDQPVHGTFRNTVFFDGHVERVPTSQSMYP